MFLGQQSASAATETGILGALNGVQRPSTSARIRASYCRPVARLFLRTWLPFSLELIVSHSPFPSSH